jgi:excinuclease UvrABC ATPase subunit
VPLAAQTVSQMVDNVLAQPEGKRLMLLSPIIKERKGEHTKTLENLASQGLRGDHRCANHSANADAHWPDFSRRGL